MKKGKRVKVINNSFLNGKEGIIENIDGDKVTVYVDFDIEENKRIRQDFSTEELEEVLTESKKKDKKKDKGKEDKKEEKDYDLSSLNTLKDAFGDDFRYFEKYPYAFNIYVSDKFMDSYKELLKKDLNRDSSKILKILDRALSKLDERGNFVGVNKERVNGIANKYIGKIMELKPGEVNKKPVRVLYFDTPNKNIVFGNILMHKESNLNASERTSCNSVFDKVFK